MAAPQSVAPPGRVVLTETQQRRNKRKSRTGFRDAMGAWYALDNAASIMPAISNRIGTSLFRVSATLDAPVKLSVLEEALVHTAKRFPYFTVELHRGLFWYYLEPFTGRLHVVADADSPSQNFDVNQKGTCLFRIRAKERRIAGEFSHTLTDGTGGFRFFKNLLVEYFRLQGIEPKDGPSGPDPDIYDLSAKPDPEEYEDSYNRCFHDKFPIPDSGRHAIHLQSARIPPYNYRITTGIIPLKAALDYAKSQKVTLTELFAALFMDAFESIYFASSEKARKHMPRYAAIEVPVNMRQFYPTKSNRNFSLFVLITEDLWLGRRDFTDILERTHYQMKLEVDKKSILRQISRNVGGSRLGIVRITPLFIKDFFAHLFFASMGESLLSTFISNIGPVSMPEGPAEHIERFDFLPAPSMTTLTNAAMLSWKGNIYLDFGSLAVSREVERCVLTRLRSLGIPVKVECNMPLEGPEGE